MSQIFPPHAPRGPAAPRDFPAMRSARAFDPGRFLRFRIGNHDAGWIRRDLAQSLRAWPGLFRLDESCVSLSPLFGDDAERSAALAPVIARLAAEGVVRGWRDERYAIVEFFGAPPLAFIERAAARFFGILTFAAHCNGYTRRGGETLMWIARRSAGKPIDPGMLDNLVGGGIAHGMSVRDTLAKEGREEAGIPAALMAAATPGRGLQVVREVQEGCQNERVHVHDLELPPEFEPANQDGEVAEFRLCPLAGVMDLIAAGELTVDASLVALDFLFRRGALREADHPEFRELVR